MERTETEMAQEEEDNGGNSDELVKNLTYTHGNYDDITGYFYDSTWEAYVFKSNQINLYLFQIINFALRLNNLKNHFSKV